MDRNDLTLAIAGALIAAFLLGWVLRWAFARLNTAGPRNAARTADLAARLHAAEDAPGTGPSGGWRRSRPRPRGACSSSQAELDERARGARAVRGRRPRRSAPPTVATIVERS